MRSRIPVALVIAAALVLSALPAAAVPIVPASALTSCDKAQFIADVTVPDGTNFAPGASFTKTWRLKNVGTCTWTTEYTLVFVSGDPMGGPASVNLPKRVSPGQTIDLSLSLTAPANAGHYFGYWQFKNASGVAFGIGTTGTKTWWVEIRVAGSPAPVNVAYDFVANYCSASWSTMQGSLGCSGQVGDPRGFVRMISQPTLENGTTDPGAGLLTVPQNVFNGDIHGVFTPIRVQAGDRFQSIINCAFGEASCDVIFRLDYQIGSGPIVTFWSAHEKYEGLYARANVDLSVLAGQDAKFILTVLANGSAADARALWVNPMITRSGTTPPVPNARNFDFGTSTSPVAPGYVQVTEATAYTAGGYGWTTASNAQSVDRGSQSDPLKRDFVTSATSAPTFRVDLPNGSYAVTVTMGDNDAPHDNMIVKANGAVMLSDVDTAAGQFSVKTFNVTVSSGSLTLQFLDAGGVDSSWVINGVSIAAGSPPSSNCNRALFISDVTIPDGTVVAPGQAFIKTWRLKNVGTCTWTTSYAMVFEMGEKMGAPDLVNLPQSVAPGQTVDMTLNLTAPLTAGSYRGYWRFQNPNGVRFGIGTDATRSWWVDIKVVGTAITATPTMTGTAPTPATPPASETPTATASATPTSSPSPTPTAAGPSATGWNTYMNEAYGFTFKFPPGSTVSSQSDTSGRVELPFTAGTNLRDKRLDVSVVSGVNPCKSPGTNPTVVSDNVTFNGIPFLKETWSEGATSHMGDFTAYSTQKGSACISLTFLLWSVVPEVIETPPPRFDPAVESAVFTAIMSSFAEQ